MEQQEKIPDKTGSHMKRGKEGGLGRTILTVIAFWSQINDTGSY
jgi:hypothetical protein